MLAVPLFVGFTGLHSVVFFSVKSVCVKNRHLIYWDSCEF